MQRVFSSGGVVYKKESGKVLWLVTKSNPSELIPQAKWRLPKGRLDDAEDGNEGGPLAKGEVKASEKQIQDAALKEVSEEGGVKAKIIEKIGTEKYYFTLKEKKYLKFVTFYLMKWEEDLPEGPNFETSEVSWLPYEEARKILAFGGEKKILDKVIALF